MPINLDTRISLDDVDIKKFLADSAAVFSITPPIPAGFSHDSADRRDSVNPITGQPESHREAVTFLVEERYHLVEKGKTVGIHKAIVALRHDIDITVSFWLLFADAIDPAKVQHGRNLLQQYDPLIHGGDLEQWVDNNLAGILNPDEFLLDSNIILTKTDLAPFEQDISQRNALFALLGIGGSVPPQTEIHVIGDYGLPSWAQGRDLELVLIGQSAILGDESQTDNSKLSFSVQNADDPAAVHSAIDDVVDALISPGCGPMETHQFKLMTLGGWPEFKIEWVPVRVRIGCCTITISIPILRTRLSELVFYVYFKTPQYLDRFILKIAENCAIRAALSSAVIGIITSNIAVAVAGFTPLFKQCIEQEIARCLYPGLVLLVEHGNWN